MHRISIIGKIISTPKINKNDKLSAIFDVEVIEHLNNSAEQSIIYEVVALDTNAAFIADYAIKGTQVMVVGTPFLKADDITKIKINSIFVRIVDNGSSIREYNEIMQSYCDI